MVEWTLSDCVVSQDCEGVSEWPALHRLRGESVLLEIPAVEVPGEVRERKREGRRGRCSEEGKGRTACGEMGSFGYCKG